MTHAPADPPADRLPPPLGALIDRSCPVRFRFEGTTYQAFAGDTIASALAANGVRLIGRSFKYHRPRAILSLDGSDANTFVTVDGVPNQPAERIPVTDGMAVAAQNYRGSLRRDRWALTALIARFLPVGFYYWAFFRPRVAWRLWERLIRARAGLGAIDPGHAWRPRGKEYDWADVVVVGAGPAGLAAAESAAAAGADVLLLDAQRAPGGRRRWFAGDAAIGPAPGIRLALETQVHGVYADGWLAATRGGRLLKIRAGQVVLATGVVPQPAVFRHNDLPGILLGDAAVALARDFGVRAGRDAVVVTADAHGYAVARALSDAGLRSLTIVDARTEPGPEADAAAQRGATILAGHLPVEAIGTRQVAGMVVRPAAGGVGSTLGCDLVCLCGGSVPDAALWCHAGGTLAYDRGERRWRLEGAPDRVVAAGAVHGHADADACIADGAAAGRHAAFAAGFGDDPGAAPGGPGGARSSHPIIVPHRHGGEFVDFDEDLTVEDIRAGVAQGFDHAQLLKRYTTLGMGPSQGRHALLAATEIAADARGDGPAAVGTTTFRPPLHGLSFASLAGEAFHPARLTPMDGWHRAAGARMMVAGAWWRPAFYGAPGADKVAAPGRALDEARHVRSEVGLIDVSTLGKIEVRGPDAAAFMERFYTFRYAKQPVGRSRYVLAVDEAGAVVDDGVACRLAEDHFYVTTTTGASDQVYRSMLWWNLHWGLDVDVTNVTGAYAAMNVAGPLSRRVLRRVAEVDVGAEAFPYLGVRAGTIAGAPARAMRVGFVGELGFEIHVPAGYGLHVWEALMAAGADDGMRPFGVEAQRLLRLEKGHIIVGQDTDGLSFPREAGMDWAVADKPDFVGRRSIEIHDRRGLDRALVGFRMSEPDAAPEEGHLTMLDGAITGRVTSSGLDTRTGDAIGLAYVHPSQSAPGSRIEIKLDGGRRAGAEVVALPFYDPDNARQELDP